MPKYRILNTATARIREIWDVEAPDEETAVNAVIGGNHDGCKVEFLEEYSLGGECDRELTSVECLEK